MLLLIAKLLKIEEHRFYSIIGLKLRLYMPIYALYVLVPKRKIIFVKTMSPAHLCIINV